MRALVAAVLLLAACTQSSATVRGVVSEVEGDLVEVTAFTVIVEGVPMRFLPVERGDYDFPLSHLREHLRTGEPVLVGFEAREDVYYAVTLADG